jgi:tetratricopeptide (TPR) repeat protein
MTVANKKLAQLYNPANLSPQALIDSFVVRLNEFRRLFTELKTAPMQYPEQDYIIVGPRGSGKSTLLQRLVYEIQRDSEMSQRVVPVLLPEEQYGILHLADLWEQVLDTLDREPGFDGVYGNFESGLNGSDAEDYAFRFLVRALQSRGRKLILFLENFSELLAKFALKDRQRLRERLITCAELRIVGASSVVLEHTYSYHEPFFDFFHFIYLRELNRDEVFTLLGMLATAHQEERVTRLLREQPERVEILRQLTGGIPRTIVLLFEIFADQERGDSFQDLLQTLDRVTPLYKHRMDGLTTAKQQIMNCMALNWDAMTVAEVADRLRVPADTPERRALETDIQDLVKNSLLQRVAEPSRVPLYQITERFFNIWYLMRCGQRNDRNRVRWFVRFLEAWCSPSDLEERARKHLSMLKEQKVDPAYAVNITQALANIHLGIELQEDLILATREFLKHKSPLLLDSLSPSDSELFDKADQLWHSGNVSRAHSFLREVVNPTLEVFELRGICALHLGLLDEAETNFLQAIEVSPGNPFCLGLYAQFLNDQRQDYDAAERYYLQALNADPCDADNLGNYARFLNYQRQDYDAAERYYLQALDADPKHVLNLGTYAVFLELEHEDYDRAERYFQQALEADPKDTFILYSYASLLEEERQNYDAAERYYSQAIELGDEWSMRGLVAMSLTNSRSAETALKYSMMLIARSQELDDRLQHAAVLVCNRRMDEAVSIVNAVLEANPDSEPVTKLSDVLLMLIAAQAYDEAWRLFNNPDFKLHYRYRPVYYALLYFDRKTDPKGYARMGGEFKETVEQLIQKVEKWRCAYFSDLADS